MESSHADATVEESWYFRNSSIPAGLESAAEKASKPKHETLYKIRKCQSTIIDMDPTWEKRLSDMLEESKKRRHERFMMMRELEGIVKQPEVKSIIPSRRISCRKRNIRPHDTNNNSKKFVSRVLSEPAINTNSPEKRPWNWRAGVKTYWEMNKVFPPVQSVIQSVRQNSQSVGDLRATRPGMKTALPIAGPSGAKPTANGGSSTMKTTSESSQRNNEEDKPSATVRPMRKN